MPQKRSVVMLHEGVNQRLDPIAGATGSHCLYQKKLLMDGRWTVWCSTIAASLSGDQELDHPCNQRRRANPAHPPPVPSAHVAASGCASLRRAAFLGLATCRVSGQGEARCPQLLSCGAASSTLPSVRRASPLLRCAVLTHQIIL